MDTTSLLRRFITAKTAAGLSPRTIDQYRRELAALIRHLPETDIAPPPEAIDTYFALCRARGNAPATVAGKYRAASSFFSWLVERRYIAADDNPMPLVTRPRVPRSQPRQAAFDDFLKLLRSLPSETWIDYRDRLGIVTLFLTGVRVAELVSLEIDDFDLVNGVLIIRRGKGGDARSVPLLPAVKTAFAACMMTRPAWAGREVFLGADGGSLGASNALTISGFRQMLKRRCKRAGIPYLNPHSFRHGLARYLLNVKGADMALIQRILGHSDIRVTANIYARWDDGGAAERYKSIMREEGELR